MPSKPLHKPETLASRASGGFWAAGGSDSVTSSSFACWSVSIGSSFSSDLWTSTRDALETLKMPWIFTLTLTFTLELDPSVWGVTFWTKKWAEQRERNQTLLITLSAECKHNFCWHSSLQCAQGMLKPSQVGQCSFFTQQCWGTAIGNSLCKTWCHFYYSKRLHNPQCAPFRFAPVLGFSFCP